jgi:hypothetical protein
MIQPHAFSPGRDWFGTKLFTVTLGLALSACTCGKAPDEVLEHCESSLSLPPSISTDILFVIDNSGSMFEEQEKVVSQLHTFITNLAKSPIKNDFQIGVVTTSISQSVTDCSQWSGRSCTSYAKENGFLQIAKDSQGNSIGPILSSENMDSAFLDNVRKLIRQGTLGSGQEMGLEVMRRAIENSVNQVGPNAGFLRPGSRLLVVIVSDEDDCSEPNGCNNPKLFLEPACGKSCASDDDCKGCDGFSGSEGCYCLPINPSKPQTGRKCVYSVCDTAFGRSQMKDVSDYVEYLQNLDDGTGLNRKREAYLAVIGAVDNHGNPSRCKEGSDEAYGVAIRYREAVDSLQENGFIDSICKPDYGESLTKIAQMVGAPQSIDLKHAPSDGHFIHVDVVRQSGETIKCRMDDGFEFAPSEGTVPAKLRFNGKCRLQLGDRLEVKVVCAG